MSRKEGLQIRIADLHIATAKVFFTSHRTQETIIDKKTNTSNVNISNERIFATLLDFSLRAISETRTIGMFLELCIFTNNKEIKDNQLRMKFICQTITGYKEGRERSTASFLEKPQ